MALPWLLVLELVLYAGCFICGIMSVASLTNTQCLLDLHQLCGRGGNMWLNVTLGMCEDIVLPGGVRRYSEDRQGPPLSVCPSQCALHNQKSVWVNVFFWVLIVVAVFVQKHQVL
ncbi:unnamed protein product, partial [Coregonus sp. 'balchen']